MEHLFETIWIQQSLPNFFGATFGLTKKQISFRKIQVVKNPKDHSFNLSLSHFTK
jgi:hypothetical protein